MINAVFRLEAYKKAGLLHPEKTRNAQAELVKYLDQMMLEASKSLVTQRESKECARCKTMCLFPERSGGLYNLLRLHRNPA